MLLEEGEISRFKNCSNLSGEQLQARYVSLGH
jgi:hypothetical protein